MSERKLASIRRIADIREIPGADNIVCAVVDGWELVTQKSNGFNVGDLVCYFEIDSVLPEREEFEFLRDRCYVSAERSVNGAGFRLKTIKLRGQVSQGLILPLDSLYGLLLGSNDYYEGMDLTELLGVVKYDKPLPAQLAGMARGNFPSFIHKTDQERIQNCFKYVSNKWQDHRWEVTMKLDGSSLTAYFVKDEEFTTTTGVPGRFGVCSRNLDLQETEGNAFWQAARKYNLEEHLRLLGRNIAIQGEIMGPGIQGNKENFSDLKMFVFDIFDIDRQTYLDSYTRLELIKRLGLDHVPIIHRDISLVGWSIEDILEEADGPSINAKLREGVVFKSLTDPNVSFKAISSRWLLKHEE